jgi:hypothetical protein
MEINKNLGIDQTTFHAHQSRFKALEQVIVDRSFSKYSFQRRTKFNIGNRVPKNPPCGGNLYFTNATTFAKTSG